MSKPKPRTPIRWLAEQLSQAEYKDEASRKRAKETVEALIKIDAKLPKFKTDDQELGLLLATSILNKALNGALCTLNGDDGALQYLGAVRKLHNKE